MTRSELVPISELGKHHGASDAWIVINKEVWDVTDFAPKHPGGVEAIREYFGQDASKAYNDVHGPSLVHKHLDSSKLKGKLDESTITQEWKSKQASNVEEEKSIAQLKIKSSSTSSSVGENDIDDRPAPPLDAILNMYDFEAAAQKLVSAKAWGLYSSAANDSLTLGSNIDLYRRIWFRPRVLVGVKDVDTSTTILGQKYALPFFSAPCALAKLSHPDGEQAMARATVAKGTTMVACNNASFSLAKIMSAMPDKHPIFYQLYFNKDRSVTEKLVKEATKLAPRAIMVTVDLPVVGKREGDERIRIEANYQAGKNLQSQKTKGDKKGSGLARATGSFIDPDLKWEDLLWLRTITDIPVFVKGIQSAADARKALEYGCAGIYISNHGGRAVDTAQPSLLTLMEIQANCPEVLEQMEVFIDGGIRRGTDILKAICLGASGVCVGRPFMYALAYGQEGMEHAIDILKDELETAMQMIGITKLSDAHPGLLNTADLDRYVYRGDAHPWARKIVRKSRL